MDRELQHIVGLKLVLIHLLVFAFHLQAAQPYTPTYVNPLSEPWRWKHFPELEGKGIRYIAETNDQRVWVSCNEGVLEYDGYTWKTHDPSNGLSASPVEQLLVTADDVLYATTSRGIFRYDGRQWEPFFTAPDDFPVDFLRVEQLSDQSIIACSNRGLIHFVDEDKINFYTSRSRADRMRSGFAQVNWVYLPEEALDDENGDFINVSDVLEVDQGSLFWLGITTEAEAGKLLKFRPDDVRGHTIHQYEVIADTDQLQLGEEQQLLQAQDGKIWVINSSSNIGIGIYDGRDWEVIHLNAQFGGDEYMADIVQLSDGSIWISSIARIFAYKDDKWRLYKAPQFPIPANRIMLRKSRNDRIWVAGYKSRMLLLDFSTDQWLSYANLSFQCEVSPVEQWFLEADNRVVNRRGDEWVSYGIEDGLMDAPIRLLRTSWGQIWVAGSHQGVAATAILRNGRWERHLHPELSWGIDYRSVFEARDGSLWFGGSVDADLSKGFRSGVLQLPDPRAAELQWIHHVYEENGLDQANVYGIAQSKDGRIWIGGSRLYYYDGESWKNLPDERLQQFVNVVVSTGDLLLVGSRYYGLFVYDGHEWINYNTTNGLSGNTIISIDARSDSCIFVATENDICRFDGRSWTAGVFPEKLNIDFEGGTILHTDEQSLWINHVPRSWKRRVYQGNKDAAEAGEFFTLRYQPTRLHPETTIDFYVESVSAEGNSLITWHGKDFFAETPADALVFSYRLDGGEWSEYSSDQQYTFTSLASGDHLLEVRARDLDFNVDPDPAQVFFRVLPPIWKQGWFIALIATFLLIFGIYEYRVLSKKRKLEILNESLHKVNVRLKEKGSQIEAQNEEILAQQTQILDQAGILEKNNKDLAERNREIRTQRDQLEEMVRKVENLSKAKLAFFTNISHELRTPLTLILGPIMQLEKDDSDLPAGHRRQLYSLVRRNASRLLKLINQLLEIRRIEHQSLEVKLSDIHLPDYITEIIDLFHELAIERNIFLEFTHQSEELLTALDADKVEKVLVNLLSNAFQHTPEGGSIGIHLRRVPATEVNLNTIYDCYFEIAVEDSGKGIARDKIAKIFEKYYTTESDLMEASHSGIGLPYIKDLVYLMQGEIRVESQVGKGTCFRVYLPCVAASQDRSEVLRPKSELPKLRIARQEASLLLTTFQQKEPEQKVAVSNSRARLLVVEDDSDMRIFLENYLQSSYQVSTAENGKIGLKLAQSQEFDLIISDVMMPEMDGLSFCEKIKEDFATSHIPVILLTAKALDESKMSGFLKGADDYITKPFNPELLELRVNNLLAQREQLRKVFNRDFMMTPQQEEVPSPDEDFLGNLVNIMNENLSDPEFNVDKMCKMVFLSHMHFIRKVKQLTGKKPVDLLKSFRMRKAKELLAQKKLSISEVAYRVGFDLPNSFSRAFKKEFSLTPSEYVAGIKETETTPKGGSRSIFYPN